jgi:capsular polysaccharide biosynthesis protein
MLECLPRLLLIENYAERTGQKPIILNDPSPPRWVTETLDMLGYEQGRDYVEWDATFATADHVIVPMFVYETGLPSARLCHQLSQRLRAALPPAYTNLETPLLYISRSHAQRRRVVNEDALLKMLSAYGFVAHNLENLSISQQIRLFSQAKCVIAPHGAGLANIIYGNDMTIIEFFEPKYINTCFYRLASGLGSEITTSLFRSVNLRSPGEGTPVVGIAYLYI